MFAVFGFLRNPPVRIFPELAAVILEFVAVIFRNGRNVRLGTFSSFQLL